MSVKNIAKYNANLQTSGKSLKHWYETSFLSPGLFSSNRPTGPIWSRSRIVCLCVCLLSPFHVLGFEAYFAPNSQNWMSKVFRDLESFGKSAGKKWSQNWTFLLWSGLKSQSKKKFVFCWFCLTKHGGNHVSRWIRDLWSKGISLIWRVSRCFWVFPLWNNFFRF